MNTDLIVPLDVVRSYVEHCSSDVTRGSVVCHEYAGAKFSFRTGRIRRILDSGTCVCCGKSISEARITRSSGGLTIDVGHVSEDGTFTKFTVDHILLDCMGGMYNNDNLQIMCVDCNTKKGDTMTLEEIRMVRANPTKYAAKWVNFEYLAYLLDMQEFLLRMIEGNCAKKEINQFRIKLSRARARMNGSTASQLVVPTNEYANILRPPMVTANSFVAWWKSMPSIRDFINHWLLSHNIFIYC